MSRMILGLLLMVGLVFGQDNETVTLESEKGHIELSEVKFVDSDLGDKPIIAFKVRGPQDIIKAILNISITYQCAGVEVVHTETIDVINNGRLYRFIRNSNVDKNCFVQSYEITVNSLDTYQMRNKAHREYMQYLDAKAAENRLKVIELDRLEQEQNRKKRAQWLKQQKANQELMDRLRYREEARKERIIKENTTPCHMVFLETYTKPTSQLSLKQIDNITYCRSLGLYR